MDIYYNTFLTVDGINVFFKQNPQHKLINIESTIIDGNYLFRVWFASGDNKVPDKTYYPVFQVNDCFDEYGMSNFYIGAKDRNDLIEHLYEICKDKCLSKKQVRNIIKDEEWRIVRVNHMFTDTPYISLDSNGYIE